MGRKPRGDYVPSSRGSGGGFDAEAIMRDFSSGTKPNREGDVKKQDLYVGRLMLGTTAAIRAIKDDFSPTETFDANNRIVVPLVLRHSLSFKDRIFAGRQLRQLQPDNPDLFDRLSVTVGDAITQSHRSGGALLYLTVCDPDNTLRRESRLVAGQLGGKYSLYPAMQNGDPVQVRVAEFEDTIQAEAARNALIEHGLVGDGLELSPAQICGAPSK